ncbi:MAG: hypothetical protein KME30_20260 [Iphinoe sp. HA4291-MV1]|jgi:hypothetical protein|nr:hypothetical protein [Iphinoe sp. HA4291-MV1]
MHAKKDDSGSRKAPYFTAVFIRVKYKFICVPCGFAFRRSRKSSRLWRLYLRPWVRFLNSLMYLTELKPTLIESGLEARTTK